MLTIILIIALISAIIASISEGNTGSIIVGIVLVVGIFALIFAGGKTSRAYNNWFDHWSKTDEERAWERKVKRTADRMKAQERWKKERDGNDDVALVNGLRTMGTVTDGEATTYQCQWCGLQMPEEKRITYSSGATFVTYRCPKCKNTRLIKL